jgi:hypothetical protein
MKTENRKTRMRPAQSDSGISILGVLGILRSLRILEGRTKNENGSPQRDSIISILETSPKGLLAVRLVPLCGDPYCPLDFKNRPAQLDSIMSNLMQSRGQRICKSVDLSYNIKRKMQREPGVMTMVTKSEGIGIK